MACGATAPATRCAWVCWSGRRGANPARNEGRPGRVAAMSAFDLDGLSLEQKAALLSGRDFWSTEPLPQAGVASIVLSDGPHGVRFQPGRTDHLGLRESAPATCFPLAVAVGSSW